MACERGIATNGHVRVKTALSSWFPVIDVGMTVVQPTIGATMPDLGLWSLS